MAWGAPLWFYLWMAGMAGGAYFAAFLVERFTGATDKKLLRLATYVGVPSAVIGVLLLVFELGQPLRFWHLFTEFSVGSPMSMGTWILLIWVAISIVMIILWWVENRLTEEVASSLRKLTKYLSYANVVFSVLLIAYTGVVLAVSNQPLWSSTVLIPSLFVTSAVSTGVALLILAAIAANTISKGSLVELRMALNQLFGSTDWTIPNKTVVQLAKANAIVILVELAVLIGYVVWLAASSMAGAGEALRVHTTGTLAILFWVGEILVALLIPLGLYIANWGKELERKAVLRAITTSATCVIIGGLVVRAAIVIGGQL